MRGVVLEVGAEELARRKLTGLDRWDEMWEGELHMSPAPADEHQRMLDELVIFLVPLLRRLDRGVLRSGINVYNEASADEDYRIPDLTFVAAGREHLRSPDGIRGGGPDAVIEIRSPNDESYEKLPFFAKIGVREVVIIDRSKKHPEVYRLAGSQYLAVAPDSDGWVLCEVLGIRLRAEGEQTAVLAIVDAADPAIRVAI